MDQALADLRDASAFVARLLVAVEAYASAEAETAAALDDVAECRAAATHVAARDQTPGDALYAEAQRLSKAHGHAMSACSRASEAAAERLASELKQLLHDTDEYAAKRREQFQHASVRAAPAELEEYEAKQVAAIGKHLATHARTLHDCLSAFHERWAPSQLLPDAGSSLGDTAGALLDSIKSAKADLRSTAANE